METSEKDLKNKILDLEDQIEDYEDDISKLKKKISEKDENLDKAESELSKEKKVAQKLKDDFDRMNNEFESKDNTLKFIQEILAAKDISTEDYETLMKNINFMESFIKEEFTYLYAYLLNGHITYGGKDGNEGLNIVKEAFYPKFEEWASTKRKSWLDGKKAIAFIGEFSAGKTSIVNRILSQDNPSATLLPVSMKATTAIPTYIAGGMQERFSFIAGDGSRKLISSNTFSKISKEMLAHANGLSSILKYFVVEYRNQYLNGLSILDTPGFNSNDKDDTKRTMEVINECDALFWVVDVNDGDIRETSRKTLTYLRNNLTKPLYIVINKVDTKSEYDVYQVERKITQTLNNAGLDIEQIIRFSHKTSINELMRSIDNVEKTGIRDYFFEYIDNDIKELHDILAGTVRDNKQNSKTSANEKSRDIEKLVNIVFKMKDACNKAAAIPHYETHLFGSDRYEMSESQYNNLNRLMDNITDVYTEDIIEKTDEIIDDVENVVLYNNATNNSQTALDKIDECQKHFNRIRELFR